MISCRRGRKLQVAGVLSKAELILGDWRCVDHVLRLAPVGCRQSE